MNSAAVYFIIGFVVALLITGLALKITNREPTQKITLRVDGCDYIVAAWGIDEIGTLWMNYHDGRRHVIGDWNFAQETAKVDLPSDE